MLNTQIQTVGLATAQNTTLNVLKRNAVFAEGPEHAKATMLVYRSLKI